MIFRKLQIKIQDKFQELISRLVQSENISRPRLFPGPDYFPDPDLKGGLVGVGFLVVVLVAIL